MAQQRKLQVGVKILFRNKEGKYLLLRNNPDKYPEIGPKWDLVGGRIEIGIDLIANLRREIKEETGFDYQGEPKLVAAQDVLRVPDRHVVRVTYTGEIDGDPILNDESDEFKWLEAREIKAMDEDRLDIYFKNLVDDGVIEI